MGENDINAANFVRVAITIIDMPQNRLSIWPEVKKANVVYLSRILPYRGKGERVRQVALMHERLLRLEDFRAKLPENIRILSERLPRAVQSDRKIGTTSLAHRFPFVGDLVQAPELTLWQISGVGKKQISAIRQYLRRCPQSS